MCKRKDGVAQNGLTGNNTADDDRTHWIRGVAVGGPVRFSRRQRRIGRAEHSRRRSSVRALVNEHLRIVDVNTLDSVFGQALFATIN